MHIIFTLFIAAVLVGCEGKDEAKKQPSPQEMQQLMGAMMNGMSPAMAQMTEMMIQAQLNVAARPETARAVATFKRNLYNQLQDHGFSEQQAMQITLTTQLPGAQAGTR